ncbi:Olfactory receptor 1K1 [Varanus komodoensis]|nr:Olfactory receptor 1K1 [Varanus komodoensis]
MSPKHCLLMAAVSWAVSNIQSLTYTVLASCLNFCKMRKVPHFFCDIQPLMRISCSDTKPLQALVMSEGLMNISAPFLLIVVSYVCIFYTAEGVLCCQKAEGLLHFTLIGVYTQPPCRKAGGKDTLVAIMYTIVTPLLNPFIYSLRNNEIKGAIRRVICRKNKLLRS